MSLGGEEEDEEEGNSSYKGTACMKYAAHTYSVLYKVWTCLNVASWENLQILFLRVK